MTHLSKFGVKKTRFSATKPHFQPIYPRNFKQMNILSSEAHGTEKCDEFQLSHTYNDAPGLVAESLSCTPSQEEAEKSIFGNFCKKKVNFRRTLHQRMNRGPLNH